MPKRAPIRARPRVALLVAQLYDEYHAGIVHGAREAAEALNLVLFCFVGGWLNGPHEERRRNHIYEFIDRENVDAIALGQLGSPADVEGLVKRLGDLPMCTIGTEIANLSCVVVDN